MDSKSLCLGAAIGSALTFMLDPNTGRRRRALVRDKMARASRKTREGMDATARDAANRASGLVAETRSRWGARPVSDRKLVERVRSKLGRVCSHPRAIDVHAQDGDVTLRGPVLSDELDAILSEVADTRGVRHVNNELEPHDTSEGVPSLQGEGSLPTSSPRSWPPATRAMAAGLVAAGLLAAMSAARGRGEGEHQHAA